LVWVELHRTAGSKVVYANPPDYPEMLVWANVLKPGDLFVDVGANIGTYTIWAGELGARVIAVEPAADTFALLRENVSLNGYPVEMFQLAAGARSGTGTFTSGRDSLNRLDPAGDVKVNVITVDDLLHGRGATGVKIDVEGYELEVLRGCVEALAAQRIHLLQIEWNRSSEAAVGTDRGPIADLLARFGYRLYRPTSEGQLVDAGLCPPYGPDLFAMRSCASPRGEPDQIEPTDLAGKEASELGETAGHGSVVGDELEPEATSGEGGDGGAQVSWATEL
jgi:FkbM family methyltransferase